MFAQHTHTHTHLPRTRIVLFANVISVDPDLYARELEEGAEGLYFNHLSDIQHELNNFRLPSQVGSKWTMRVWTHRVFNVEEEEELISFCIKVSDQISENLVYIC